MTPHLTDELAQSLVDGLLPPERVGECRAHARACEECRVLVESYAALGEALGGLASPPPPAGFTDAVMQRIDARERTRAWERRLALGILGATACASLAIFAALGAFAPVVSSAIEVLGAALRVGTLGTDLVSPLVRALRLEIAIGCAAACAAVTFALSRLAAPAGAST